MTDSTPRPDGEAERPRAHPRLVSRRGGRFRVPPTGLIILALVVPAAVATIAAMVLLWPGQVRAGTAAAELRILGEVVDVLHSPCPTAGDEPQPPGLAAPVPSDCGNAYVRLRDGGDVVVTDIPTGPGAPKLAVGDGVVLLHTPDALSGRQYQIVDHQRTRQLWVFAASLPLMLLLAAADRPIGEVISGESLTQEIVRSGVGTLGLIAAVPITTVLATLAAVRTAASSSRASATTTHPTPPANADARPPEGPARRRRRIDPLESAWADADDGPGLGHNARW